MKVVILGGGTIYDYTLMQTYIHSNAYIICADSGVRHARQMNIIPNMILGDFDSVEPNLFQEYKQLGIPIIDYPPEKDKTDSHLALEYALSLNPKEIILLGYTGSRLDHTIANIHTLQIPLTKKTDACILNETNKVFLVDESKEIKNDFGKYVSFIPLAADAKVSAVKGVKYPIYNKLMRQMDSLGVSNELTQESCILQVHEGIIIVIQSKD